MIQNNKKIMQFEQAGLLFPGLFEGPVWGVGGLSRGLHMYKNKDGEGLGIDNINLRSLCCIQTIQKALICTHCIMAYSRIRHKWHLAPFEKRERGKQKQRVLYTNQRLTYRHSYSEMMHIESLDSGDVISDHKKADGYEQKSLNTNTKHKTLEGGDVKIKSILLQSNVML